jgi:hypothetical protein
VRLHLDLLQKTINSMKVDIKGSSLELAALIKQDPSLVEKNLLSQGNSLLALFEDTNFSNSFQNFKALKRELFCSALEDLAMGAITLKTSVMGLTFKEGKVKTFITPFGVNPDGNIMFSISLKSSAAFKNWRTSAADTEISQEELNSAIYRIVIALSEVV